MSDDSKRAYFLPPQGNLILPGKDEINTLVNSLRQYPQEALWEYLEKTGTSGHFSAQILRQMVRQAIKLNNADRRLARKGVKK